MRLPGRGDRLLPPGASSVLVEEALRELAPRLLGEPYVLAICHGGDPTADEDRLELERARLPLQGGSALPDIVMLDVRDATLWLVEVVVSGGEIGERRRVDLLACATAHGFDADGCRFVTVYRSRSEAVFRRTVGSLAWDTLVWFADEPDHILRLESMPKGVVTADAQATG